MTCRSAAAWLTLSLPVASCQVTKNAPYAPPPVPALVESVEVEVSDFEGRPEVHAIVRGRLSSSVAQLVDAKQSRLDRTVYLQVLEQTPRGAVPLAEQPEVPPFETRIPVEILGFEPGSCLLNVNGIEVPFEIPRLHAVLASFGNLPTDDLVKIEDLVPHSAAPAPIGVGL